MPPPAAMEVPATTMGTLFAVHVPQDGKETHATLVRHEGD